MGGLNMLDSLIQSEIKVIKGVLEGQFTNMAGIFGSLGAKAPSVSGSIGFGFKMAKKNFDEGKKKLDAPTRQGLDKVSKIQMILKLRRIATTLTRNTHVSVWRSSFLLVL
jgi:hypothetical protein